MKRLARVLLGGLAVLSLAIATSCGGGADESSEGGFGDCEVTGKKGSVELEPVTSDALTVETNLPSPGWWSGTSPETIDGGFEYCLAANIAHRAGLDRVKVVNVSFDALVAGQTKDYDMALAQVSITPEREKVVTFSEPYYDSDIGLLTKSEGGVTAQNYRSKRLGVQLGTTAVAFAKTKLKLDKPAKVYPDTDSLITAVTSGQIDGALQDTAIMLGFAKKSRSTLKVIGQFESGEEYGAIYPKGSANAKAVDDAIAAMEKDGSMDALRKQWLGKAFGGDPGAVPRIEVS